MISGYYKKPIEDIISAIISAMDFTVNIYNVSVSGNFYTLNVDDAFHAQAGAQNIVTIGGNQYTITSVTYGTGCDTCDVLIVEDLSGTNPISSSTISFTMYSPFYFYGTLNETGSELNQQSDASLKSPMLFLQLDKSLKEKFYADPQDSHERTTNVNIYALIQNDYTQTTSGLISQGVTPMRRLFENFIEQIKNTVGIFEKLDFDYELNYYTKVYVSNSKAQLWSDQLSGVGATLPFKILGEQD